MSFEDVLKAYQPVENEDEGGFEVLKGTYKCTVTKLGLGETRDKRARYELELTVNEVKEGNGSPGRKLWRNYMKDDDKKVENLLNDLFTADIAIPKTSVAEFESSLMLAIDAEVTVKAWGWAPEKDMKGADIPPEDRKAQQMFKIVNPSKTKKSTKAASLPF